MDSEYDTAGGAHSGRRGIGAGVSFHISTDVRRCFISDIITLKCGSIIMQVDISESADTS